MARVLTDIVRPEVRRDAQRRRAARPFDAAMPDARMAGPTSLTVFYDGGSERLMRRITALRRAAGNERPDILWRDLRRHPLALTCWHVLPEDWEGRLYVVDRTAALRKGLAARRLIRREIAARGIGPLPGRRAGPHVTAEIR